MSASSKKKLRNAENAEKLTEKQLAEQKEAKKLKIMSTVMVVVVAVMVVFAAWTAITNTIENSGIRERSTVALTVGDHEINNAELNYFYVDSINNFYRNYGNYASMFGLDLTVPLDEQYVNEEAGITWADDFLASAKENAKAVYAIADEAKAQGYTLTEEQLLEVDNALSYLEFSAVTSNYPDSDSYMKALYGKGATKESLKEYYELTMLVNAFLTDYQESLSYTDEDLRAAESENYDQYSSFSYHYYNLSVSKYEENGTEEEKADPAAAAKADAEALAAAGFATVEEFNAAIADLSINASSTNAASTSSENTRYSSVSSLYREWVADDSRTAGDMEVFENTTTDTEGNETVSGYYVVYYVGSNDNKVPMSDVRHILVQFEGGETGENGITTYSAEEMNTAKTEADAILAEWKAGEATEESFADLAVQKSDDTGSSANGGLIANISYDSSYVENFLNWSIDESRQIGDTDIVETEYGYHVMYFCGNSELNYRDYLISEELRSAEYNEWYNGLVEAMTMTEGDIKYINTGIVLSASGM